MDGARMRPSASGGTGGIARSLPSARISTRRPSAFNRTRIIATSCRSGAERWTDLVNERLNQGRWLAADWTSRPMAERANGRSANDLARLVENLAADQHAANFARPRPDLVELGVAQQAPSRVVVDVAV